MKTIKLIILLLSFTSLLKAQDRNYALQLIDTLSAPGMHGRGYVFEGDKKAAHFIKAEFVKMELQPFNNNYFQPFPFSVNTFPGKVDLSAGSKILKPGIDYLILPHSGSDSGTYHLSWLDYKTWKNSRKFKAFKKIDFSDKYLVIDDAGIKTNADKEIHKAMLANPFKAKGIIKLTGDKLTWSVSRTEVNYTALEVLRTSFPKRARTITLNVENEFFNAYISQNVAAYIKGLTMPDSFIVFTAHYDHLGRMGEKTYFPGANDNASGIALLSDIAGYYSKNPPAYSIAFIAFSAEEAGLVGSEYYVKNPLFPLNKIKFLINLDLLGSGEQGITVVNGSVFEHEFGLLNSINSSNNYITKINKRGKAANSDHYYFTEKGIKSFFIYALGGSRAYHDINDTPENVKLPVYDKIFLLLKDFTDKLSNNSEQK